MTLCWNSSWNNCWRNLRRNTLSSGYYFLAEFFEDSVEGPLEIFRKKSLGKLFFSLILLGLQDNLQRSFWRTLRMNQWWKLWNNNWRNPWRDFCAKVPERTHGGVPATTWRNTHEFLKLFFSWTSGGRWRFWHMTFILGTWDRSLHPTKYEDPEMN